MRRNDAWAAFMTSAAKKPPTRRHRPAIWENMLGTVYAANAAGIIEYFDYDYNEAVAHVGPHRDVRVARAKSRGADYQGPRIGQLVWFVIDEEVARG